MSWYKGVRVKLYVAKVVAVLAVTLNCGIRTGLYDYGRS